MKEIRVLIGLLLLACPLSVFSDVKGVQESLRFDSDSDGAAEMVLNSIGLGVGGEAQANLHIYGDAVFSKGLTVGGVSVSSSNLNVSGSIGFNIQNVSSNTTLGESSVVFMDTLSSNITVTLPTASSQVGRVYKIKKLSTSANLTIRTSGNELLDGIAVYRYEMGDALPAFEVMSSGTNWFFMNMTNSDNLIADVSDNLVLWFDFEENGGNVLNDRSGFANHGVMTGGFSMATNTVTGIQGQALRFDDTDIITVADSDSLDFTSNFSFVTWYYQRNSGPDRPAIFSKSGAYSCDVRNSNNSSCYLSNNGSALMQQTAGVNYSSNEWQHIAITFNSSGNLTFYKNGTAYLSTENMTSNLSVNTNDVIINSLGLASSSTEQLGDLDEYRLYNRELSAAEIQQIYRLSRD